MARRKRKVHEFPIDVHNHRQVAAVIFDKPIGTLTPEEISRAKTATWALRFRASEETVRKLCYSGPRKS